MTALPSTVKATLNHVLFQAFRPEGNIDVNEVYVCGLTYFQGIQAFHSGWSMISPGNMYINRKLYVLNMTLEANDFYGPFDMMEIFVMPRIPVLTSHEVLKLIDDKFPGLETLKRGKCWTLPMNNEDIICSIDIPPVSIKKSIDFVSVHLKEEMKLCMGCILIPSVLTSDEESERIKVIRRDGYHITLLQSTSGVWFLIQSCRTAFFDGITNWFYQS